MSHLRLAGCLAWAMACTADPRPAQGGSEPPKSAPSGPESTRGDPGSGSSTSSGTASTAEGAPSSPREEAALDGLPAGWVDTLQALQALQGGSASPEAALKALDLRVLDSCVPTEDHPLRHQAHLAVARHTPDPVAAFSRLKKEPALGETWELLRTRYLRADERPRGPARKLLLETPEARPARELADRLGTRGLARLLSESERLRRAERLLTVHENERARKEALAWLGSRNRSAAHRCRLAYVVGKASRKLRQYRAAQDQLRQAQRLCEAAKDPEMVARSILLQAHVAKIRGQAAELERLAQVLVETVGPDHSYWDDIRFKQALVLEKDQPERARAVLRDMIEQAPTGDMRAEAEWKLAWSALRAGRPQEARAHLKPWTTAADRRIRERAQYWTARISEPGEDANRTFLKLMANLSYYGQLARGQLQNRAPQEAARAEAARLQALRTAAAPSASPQDRISIPEVKLAESLAQRGRPDAARWVLRGAACRSDLRPKQIQALAQVMLEAGDPAFSQRLMRRVQASLLGAIDPDAFGPPQAAAWRTAYSRPFESEVGAAAQAESLDPWLLFALAREESTFDPDIVSWAGAVGLAQLMPPTAAAAFASIEGKRLDPERLTDPSLNLRLGAHVLREGLDRFHSVPLALSHYNAGGGLTSRFVRQGSEDFDRFVESIGVRQTRRYVKKVVESWVRYHALYGTGPLPTLPDRVPDP